MLEALDWAPLSTSLAEPCWYLDNRCISEGNACAMPLLFQQMCFVYKCNQRSVLTHSVVLLQQDSYLQALVRAVQHTDANLQIPAVQILACLIAQDPSTHYVCAEVGTTTQADVAYR